MVRGIQQETNACQLSALDVLLSFIMRHLLVDVRHFKDLKEEGMQVGFRFLPFQKSSEISSKRFSHFPTVPGHQMVWSSASFGRETLWNFWRV